MINFNVKDIRAGSTIFKKIMVGPKVLWEKVKEILDLLPLYISRVEADGGTYVENEMSNEIVMDDSLTLLLTPNGYKDGKLYSALPTDGSGDFVVDGGGVPTINTTETVIPEYTNLVIASNEIYDKGYAANWTERNVILEGLDPEQYPNPITGGVTDFVGEAWTTTDHYFNSSPFDIIEGESYRLSTYVSNAHGNGDNKRLVALQLGSRQGGSNNGAVFDLDNQTFFTPTSNGLDPMIEDMGVIGGNQWFRCSVTVVAASTTTSPVYIVINDGSTTDRTITNHAGVPGVGFMIAAIQVTHGTETLPYIPTELEQVTRPKETIYSDSHIEVKEGMSNLLKYSQPPNYGDGYSSTIVPEVKFDTFSSVVPSPNGIDGIDTDMVWYFTEVSSFIDYGTVTLNADVELVAGKEYTFSCYVNKYNQENDYNRHSTFTMAIDGNELSHYTTTTNNWDLISITFTAQNTGIFPIKVMDYRFNRYKGVDRWAWTGMQLNEGSTRISPVIRTTGSTFEVPGDTITTTPPEGTLEISTILDGEEVSTFDIPETYQLPVGDISMVKMYNDPNNIYKWLQKRVNDDGGTFVEQSNDDQVIREGQKLLLTPNAYDTGKLYSAIPTDGSGDFVYDDPTKEPMIGDNAIEVKGLDVTTFVEDTESLTFYYNYSDVTTNVVPAPFGESWTTYEVYISSGAYSRNSLNQTISSYSNGNLKVLSVYVKDETIPVFGHYTENGGYVVNDWSDFSYEDVGDGWYRHFYKHTNPGRYIRVLRQNTDITFNFSGLMVTEDEAPSTYYPGDISTPTPIVTTSTPEGVDRIYETVDGVTTKITTIPTTYQLPEGSVDRVEMFGGPHKLRWNEPKVDTQSTISDEPITLKLDIL